MCHIYVYSVAATHTKNISRTLQSHHASMQRLNSICAVGNGSNRQEMVVVYNGNIDTCLLYSGRPANNSNSQVGPHLLSVSTPGHLDSGHTLNGRNKVENKSISKPRRTAYLLFTPLAILISWLPSIISSIMQIKQQNKEEMREPITLRSQLSVLVPLLALGCLNPWLYHKLSLTCCHGDSHGDPDRTEAAHHQWQDSPSPSPSHSGHQASGVTRHGQQVIRVSPALLDQGEEGAETHNNEKLVNRDLVEMVKFLENQARMSNSKSFANFKRDVKPEEEISCASF